MTTSWEGWPPEGTSRRAELERLYWGDVFIPPKEGYYWEPLMNTAGQNRFADVRQDATLRILRFVDEWQTWRQEFGSSLALRTQRRTLPKTRESLESAVFLDHRRIAQWHPAQKKRP